jgi:hypothetical protein
MYIKLTQGNAPVLAPDNPGQAQPAGGLVSQKVLVDDAFGSPSYSSVSFAIDFTSKDCTDTDIRLENFIFMGKRFQFAVGWWCWLWAVMCFAGFTLGLWVVVKNLGANTNRSRPSKGAEGAGDSKTNKSNNRTNSANAAGGDTTNGTTNDNSANADANGDASDNSAAKGSESQANKADNLGSSQQTYGSCRTIPKYVHILCCFWSPVMFLIWFAMICLETIKENITLLMIVPWIILLNMLVAPAYHSYHVKVLGVGGFEGSQWDGNECLGDNDNGNDFEGAGSGGSGKKGDGGENGGANSGEWNGESGRVSGRRSGNGNISSGNFGNGNNINGNNGGSSDANSMSNQGGNGNGNPGGNGNGDQGANSNNSAHQNDNTINPYHNDNNSSTANANNFGDSDANEIIHLDVDLETGLHDAATSSNATSQMASSNQMPMPSSNQMSSRDHAASRNSNSTMNTSRGGRPHRKKLSVLFGARRLSSGEKKLADTFFSKLSKELI